ncbi:hypothetical protein MKEN_01185900 [Mycena kentingensis (nom. inval.)]|nr:hypothetical protein MKEN_01185900 [Mycena kentingensis (nom. inval.)]
MSSPTRKSSLRLVPNTKPQGPAPIPPSLVSSPLLNSPQSLFRRNAAPRIPTGAEDDWLRDTVPAAQKGPAQPTKPYPRGLSRASTITTIPLQRPRLTPSLYHQPPSSDTHVSRLRSESDGATYFAGF